MSLSIRKHLKYAGLLVCLPLGLLVNPAHAQLPARSMTLDEALGVLDKQGAPMQSLRQEEISAEAQRREGLSIRNPEVSYAREDLADGGEKYREWTLGLRKDFVNPGIYWARREALRHREFALKKNIEKRRALVRGALREAFLKSRLKQEEIRSLQSLQGLVDAMVRAGQAKFEEKNITSFELFRLSSAQARVRTLLSETGSEYKSLTRRMAAWLFPEGGAQAVEPKGEAAFTSLAQDTATLFRQLESQSPDLLALESQAREAEAGLREARYGLLPELSLSGGWKSQNDGLSGPSLEISAPVPLLNWNGAERARKNAQVRHSRLELQQARRMLRNELASSVERLAGLEERAREYEALLKSHPFPAMTTALEASYVEGQKPAFEVLDGLFGLHESLAGYHGVLLERENLNIQIGILTGGNAP